VAVFPKRSTGPDQTALEVLEALPVSRRPVIVAGFLSSTRPQNDCRR
jgi:hypothetical protein